MDANAINNMKPSNPTEHGVFGGHFVRLNWGCPLLVSVACHVPGQYSSTAVYTLLPLGQRGRSSAWPSVFALLH